MKRPPLVSLRCSGDIAALGHDEKHYMARWESAGPNDSYTDPSFISRDAQHTKGEDYWGQLMWYPAGGYVANLGKTKTTALNLLRHLKNHTWIDMYTRGVFVEFNLYNPSSGLFSLVTLLCEFMPTGGSLNSFSAQSVVLYRYTGAKGLGVLLSEIFAIVCTLILTGHMIRCIVRQRMAYFSSIWNYQQLLVLVLIYAGFGSYIYRTVWTAYTVEDMMNNRGM